MSNELMKLLARPFHPSVVEWKPGSVTKDGKRALAMAYADIRAYQERLDEAFGVFGWQVRYQPWRDDRLIAIVSVHDPKSGAWVDKASTGEPDPRNGSGNEGTTVEAQAFKRACVMIGIGRYLYEFPATWADYDQGAKTFSGSGMNTLNKRLWDHYNKVTGAREAPPVAPEPPPVADDPPKQTARQQEADDDAKLRQMAGVQDNPFNKWPVADDQKIDMLIDAPLVTDGTDLHRMVDWLREQEAASGQTMSNVVGAGKKISQYGYLVSLIDKRYGKNAHYAILSYVCGARVSKNNLPGEKMKVLIDWLSKPEDNTLKIELLDTLSILLGAWLQEE